MSDDLAWKDATELARMVRDGEASPAELVEAAIARVEALNPLLNAVVTPMFDEAREAAAGELPAGPLRGVPFLLKDLTAACAGVPMGMGSAFMKGYVPGYDSELVARLRRAGLVVVGKTNTPEFGILPTTEPVAFGASKNPWNPKHTTGGSSGGSAAAVAAGMVPMAHANDGGGSIRIPAACCGLFGLKPTRARNPLGPDAGDAMSGLVCEHAVTRSVRDSAALLDATSGPDVGDPYPAPPKTRPFLQEAGAHPGSLRIGLTLQSFTGVPLSDDCVAAAGEVGALCQELGHKVEEAKPDVDGFAMSEAFMTVWAAGVAAKVQSCIALRGRSPRDDELEPLTRALWDMGRQAGSHQYLMAVNRLQRIARAVGRFMLDYDVWLTPTLGEPPVPLGTFDAQPESPTWGLTRAGLFVPFTPIANVTGQPAMNVPLVWNQQGLPIGTHFVGRFGDEATLFRLAGQLEKARPWRDRHPPISA